jgi:hypothetical protein
MSRCRIPPAFDSNSRVVAWGRVPLQRQPTPLVEQAAAPPLRIPEPFQDDGGHDPAEPTRAFLPVSARRCCNALKNFWASIGQERSDVADDYWIQDRP